MNFRYTSANWSNPYISAPLALLASVFFMWSNNGHIFSIPAISLSTGFLLLIALALFLIIHITAAILSLNGKRQQGKRLFFIAFCTLAILAPILFFLDIPLKGPLKNIRPYIIIVGFLLISFILYKDKAKVINIFFATSIIFSSVNYIVNTYVDNASFTLEDKYIPITFVHTPNIYLFWLESFHDINTLQNVYDIDTHPWTSFLHDHNFTIYDTVYSQGQATLISMATTYAMRDGLADMQKANQDVAMFLRKIIGGGEHNVVFRTLKHNEYKTISIVNSHYFYPQKYEYLDESDIEGSLLGIRTLHPIYELNHSFRKRILKLILPHKPDRPVEDTFYIIQDAVQKAQKGPQPFFITFKGGANHTYGAYTWRKRVQWVNEGRYQQLYEKGVRDATSIIEEICDKDPSAIVILLGDHGAWLLRDIWQEPGITDLASLELFLTEQELSLEDLAADFFGIFAAIRMPENLDMVTQGTLMTPVNLFRFIFASLAQDPNYLQYTIPAVSYLGNYRLVVDGVVQRPRQCPE